ncbi:MAG: hypothetical protein JNL50_14685 [Phycisphaerae bacterium]|nr:hypothetical protein [Phycisphaerae bacterium]
MAGRTSTSVGMGIAITVLSVLALGFFVLATVFYGKFNKAQGELKSQAANVEQYVKASEQQRDDIRQMLQPAKAKNKSVVGYLAESMQTAMQRVTGNKNDTPDTLGEKLSKVEGADSSSLLSVLESRAARVKALEDQVASAEAARAAALADKQAEVDRVKGIEDRHAATIAAISTQVEEYKKEVDTFRDGTNKARSDMEARVASLSSEFAQREQELTARISKLQEENLVAAGQIAKLRGERNQELFKGRAEESLVDAKVVALKPNENAVVIGIGKRQKIDVGMTFAVYADAASIKIDPNTGDYPRGKANVEVIAVSDATATCRLLSESKGNPVAVGDAVANALYDPNKTYAFLIYGNFDVNNDGIATPLEQSDLKALIEGWGGRSVDDLGGDVDFLVLGQRPILPPRPGADAPIELLQEFIRLSRIVERYDALYKQAISTGLPVLNENRLYTLIGRERAGAR